MKNKPDEELEYYATMFKKIRNKKYEFFVISKIIHLLNDRELEFTTQQLVRTESGHFLLDLYFPQLKIALEVDESYHNNRVDKDKERDKAVVALTKITICRIPVSGKKLIEVNRSIDGFVKLIKKTKNKLKKSLNFAPYSHGEKYNTQKWLNKKSLSVTDDARFRTHVEVARLFGKKFEGHQRATFRLDRGEYVWFPKLYNNKDWSNELTSDGKIITMSKVKGGRYTSKIQKVKNEKTLVFAHYRDDFGKIYYAFKGVFEGRVKKKNYSELFKISDKISFDGKGNYNYKIK